MKFNKWTMGLAALGVVSLASAARADEAKMSQVQTALSNTTLSGYVDTSMQFNPTGSGSIAPVTFQGLQAPGNQSKANGWNLNVIDIALDKPVDEGPWAAGYHVEMWLGPDAATLGTTRDSSGNYQSVAIRQGYIAMRAPVGNGLDVKLGVFDTIIGYESTSSPLNPNYTRSYGYSMEPTTHTGVLLTYKFTDALSVTAGAADSKGPVINDRSAQANGAAVSMKTFMGSVSLTAPTSWGWASGASLTAGVINGIYSNQAATAPYVNANDATTSWYVGGTLPTPNANLKLGASFDYETAYQSNNPWALAGYVNFQASPKLSLNGRVEWAKNYLTSIAAPAGYVFQNAPEASEQNAVAFTGTIQYSLYANVLTRFELRWDHASNDIYGGSTSGGGTAQDNAVMIAANVIYQF